ncbi:transmembrane protein, putative (macronuclear) [Tetrahymena thermophila SB210]|uniref:Transmembrane protein, putative n=1 Tax=Tetrahymena thermophila (strain SB210) TaxID=312017 RepID=Q23H41_TETTS|nr:transmembrane protein, putative [Tetrahymena thermophila SB210]EAR95806.1 transmembrane protein, putative [Tetrahymena thermophila SB210]|eukprot:XP_001016051.1 transmembrane protein, putative [Tetrahymena thermophila SB210]
MSEENLSLPFKKKLPIRDDSLITMDNLDDLNEEETLILLDKWQNEKLPKNRMFAFFLYNCVMCGLTMYYTMNFKHYSKKFFKPKEYTFREIVKYGTIQSTVFIGTYLLGAAVVTNFWNPAEYVRGYAKIQGRIIDNTIKFDPYVQNYVLYDVMKYFNLSPNLLNQAKKELDNQQKTLEENNFFTEETKELIHKSQEDYESYENHKKSQKKEIF